ncbi:hypothetical protein F5Y12DRAFT_758639 [Xylaria sp. FL1777]|nr:hypothetical protein F5Y12DRAFT_758639 [Xylaria sp. FL1777]
MAVVLDPQEQPDFQALGGYLHGMSIEVSRCSNLMAVHNTDAILVAINQLNTTVRDLGTTLRREMADMKTELRREMADMKTELRREMADMKTELRREMADMKTELRADIHSLELRIDDMDYNNRARLFNSRSPITRPDSIIRPLKNTTKHEVVLLPGTVRELEALRVADVEEYLAALGEVPQEEMTKKSN